MHCELACRAFVTAEEFDPHAALGLRRLAADEEAAASGAEQPANPLRCQHSLCLRLMRRGGDLITTHRVELGANDLKTVSAVVARRHGALSLMHGAVYDAM